jgi:hypothetical protein
VVLGSIDMEVPPAPAGRPRFEITFNVHTDGTLKVEVADTRRDRHESRVLIDIHGRAWRGGPGAGQEQRPAAVPAG